MSSSHWNAALGLLFGAFSLFSLVWWIPSDIETGLIEEDRYSVHIGDAMMPTILAIALLALSALLLVQSVLSRRREAASDEASEDAIGLDAKNSVNLLIMFAVISLSLVLMVWTGPVLVEALNGLGVTDKSYRQLSDTPPYKYTGFALGGFVMVLGLITWVQGRVTWRAVATAAGMVMFLVVIYDVPFNSLLLPPNGSH